jgi:hypothetical protein
MIAFSKRPLRCVSRALYVQHGKPEPGMSSRLWKARGKSLGIADLTHLSVSHKDPRRGTHIPMLAIRAPKNGGKDLALGMALCAAFGIVPAMPWYVRRCWLIHALAEASVECLIIDDAQDLNLAHLAFLKELTDNLAAPPYERQVSLCLVTAHIGAAIPLKEIFSRPETRLPTISSPPGYRATFLCGCRPHAGGGAFYPGRL